MKYMNLVFVSFLFMLVSVFSPLGADTSVKGAISTMQPVTPAPQDLAFLPRFQELLAVEDCELPCWWGFMPGEATVSDIEAFLRLNFSRGFWESWNASNLLKGHEFELDFTSGYEGTEFDADFIAEDEQLKHVVLSFAEPNEWLEWGRFQPSAILASLGVPNDLRIGINSSTQRFGLVLIYSEQGVWIEYSLVFGDDQYSEGSNPIWLCPRAEQIITIRLRLQAPAKDGIDVVFFDAPPPTDRHFPALEAVTGINLETFTKFLIAYPDGCIKGLSYLELVENGWS